MTSSTPLAEPSAIGTLDSEKLMLDPAAAPDAPAAAQWADALPKLLQARFVQSFENAGFTGSVIRSSDVNAGDYQLQTDIRSFGIKGPSTALSAEFELAAKLLNSKGRIVAGRLFKRTLPLGVVDARGAAAGLSAAFEQSAAELVLWTTDTVAALPPPKTDDAAAAPAP